MIYLTLPELICIAERVLDGDVKVRDYGLLETALARALKLPIESIGDVPPAEYEANYYASLNAQATTAA